MALNRKTRMYEPWGYQEENDYVSNKTQIEIELEKLFASAKYNEDDKKIHFYNLDGEELKDSALDTTKFAGGGGGSVIESATYDKVTKILTIVFTNGDVVEINLADLIDENEFGDGLQVIDSIVSVKLKEGEKYLSVDENGLATGELDSTITNINSSITEINSAITEIEGDVININSSITEINSAITEIQGDVININSSITEINSAITNVEGDIYNINSSITEINSAITNFEGDIYNINSSITEINSAITNIQGDIININSAITVFEGDIYNITSSITEITSALTEDYYTKPEIDEKEDAIMEIIRQDEETTAAAFNDLNVRVCGNTVAIAEETTRAISAETSLQNTINNIHGDIDELFVTKFDDVEYDETAKTINFIANDNVVKQLDATPFIKDGMVDSVEIKDVEISGQMVTCLVIIFNTDAGKEEIDIPLSDIFDLSNYYTKAETDDLLSNKFGFATTRFDPDGQTGPTEPALVFYQDQEHSDPQAGVALCQVPVNDMLNHSSAVTSVELDSDENKLVIKNFSTTLNEITLPSGSDELWESGTGNKSAQLVRKNVVGEQCDARGSWSLAEGAGTISSGACAHAEGSGTTAGGDWGSHAEGRETKALGASSHAEGDNTIAYNECEHAGGHFNASTTGVTVGQYIDDDATLFSIGNGNMSADKRHNAFEVKANGDVYISNTTEPGDFYEKPMFKLQDVIGLLGRINDLTARVEYLEGLFRTDENNNIPLNQEGEPY